MAVGLRLSGRRIDAEQSAAVPLTEEQGEQGLRQGRERGATLGPDVLGKPRDMPRVTIAVQYVSKLGEPYSLGDDQTVQADEFVGVDPEHDARRQLLKRGAVAGRVEGNRHGQVLDHRREQRVLITEVGINCALRHFRGGGQLVERGSPEAGPQENAQRRGQDLGFPGAPLGRRGPAPLALGSYLRVHPVSLFGLVHFRDTITST